MIHFGTLRRRQFFHSIQRNFHNSMKICSSRPVILLYQRTESRVGFPRSMIGLSILNSMYWIWYTFDFIPAVNQSPIAELHMSTSFGFTGIGFSVLCYTLSTLYPSRLVSKLEYDQANQNLICYQHTMAGVYPDTHGNSYPLGTITVDATSSHALKLTEEKGAFRGTLTTKVKEEYLPLFMDIQQNEVKDLELLLKVFYSPWDVSTRRKTFRDGKRNTTRKQNLQKKRKKYRVPVKRH